MHRVPARWAKLAGLMVAFALVMPAIATGVLAQEGGDKILRVHQTTYPDTIDPQKSSFTNEIAILQLAYEGLTRLNEKQETVPAAAESWEYNDDATQLTFRLREGLEYSDGSPITAESFRYAVERTCDPRTAGEYKSILFEIEGCADFAGLAGDDPARLWSYYLQLVRIEEAFRNLKGDLAIRPIFHQLENRVEAHIFIAFLAYCLHVTLARRLSALAPGLTPRSVLEKFSALQMIDVQIPTTDGREIQLTRHTEPQAELKLLLAKLRLELPPQPPPKITPAQAASATLS